MVYFVELIMQQEEEIERLNKVGERVLDASTNGLVVDLYFSQYSTEKGNCI